MTDGSRAARRGLRAFLMFFAVSSTAHAISIPPVTVDDYTVVMHSYGFPTSFPDPGQDVYSYQLGSLSAPAYCCGVEALGIPEPFLFTNVSAAPSTSTGSSAALTVYFEVAGPANVYVPLIVTGTLEAGTDALQGATGVSLAEIELTSCLVTGCSIASGQANFAECLAASQIFPCDQIVAGTLLHFSVLSNTEYGLYYYDSATSDNLSGALATGFAEIDPVVSFDPSFTNAANFRIFLSNGIGNSATAPGTAPEPGTFALVALALVAASTLRRQVRS